MMHVRLTVGSWRLGIVSGLIGLCSACGSASDSEDSQPSPYSGFAIAAVPGDYSSSSLYYQGLQDGAPIGEVKTLLTGESGDPWLTLVGANLYFFNRSATSSNFRTLDPKAANGDPSAQRRTELAGMGDPHAAIKLDDSRLLLAHNAAGKLVVINPTDGGVLQDVTAEWDLGSDATAILRPKAFYRPSGADDGTLYVLHQGITADYLGFNGSQQLFILKDNGTQLSVIDTDATTPKIQGIKLNVFNPQMIVAVDDPKKPVVAGLCTIYATVNPCVSGFERVDLASRTSVLIQDLTAAPYKGNGFITAGQGGRFYAAVAPVNGDGTPGKTSIYEFDPAKGLADGVYEIADANYASFALSYDLTTGRLLIAEAVRETGTGKITMLKPESKGADQLTVNLPLIPYQIEFIP